MMDMEMNAELERDDDSDNGEPTSEGSSAESFFCALEEDYEKIKSEMEENEDLAKYKAEYSRLFELLYRAHKTEKELVEERQLLKDEIEELRVKLKELSNTTAEQNAKLDGFQQEIEFSQKLVDDANFRESKAHEDAENLKVMIANLESKLQDVKPKPDKQIGADKKDKSFADRDAMMGEVEVLKYNYRFAMDQIKELEKVINNLNREKSETEDLLDSKINEFIQERRLREKSNQAAEKLQIQIEDLEKKLKLANLSYKTVMDANLKQKNDLKEKSSLYDHVEKEKVRLLQQTKELSAKNDKLRFINETLNGLLTDKKTEMSTLTIDHNRLSETYSKVKSEKELLSKKLLQAEKQLGTLTENMKQAKVVEEKYELERTAMMKTLNEEQSKIEGLTRTLEEMSKNDALNKSTITSLRNDLHTQILSERRLQTEFEDLSKRYNELVKSCGVLHIKKDKLTKEVQDLNDKIEDQQNDMKEQRLEVENYKRLAVDFETKYRLQLSANQTTNMEKMSMKKVLRQAQDEVDYVKNQLKVLNDQIKFHKDQILVKENTLHQQEFQLGKAEKDKEDLQFKLQKSLDTVRSLKKDNEDLKKLEKELRDEMHVMSMDFSKQRKEIESMKSEKEYMANELMKRGNEINALSQKIKLMDINWQRGQAEYRNRENEIRLLKLEVNKIRSERDLLIKKIQNSSDLRMEVLKLHRNLTRERIKVTALSKEAETPLNFHRWRQLEGNDNVIELQKKVSLLNKRVLKLTTNLIKSEKKAKEAEDKNESLQELMDKRCKPEMTKELLETRAALKQKEQKIHSLLGEIGVWMRNKDEHKMEIEKLNQDLRDMKEKYYALKLKQHKICQSKIEISKAIEPSKEQQPVCPGDFIMTSVSIES